MDEVTDAMGPGASWHPGPSCVPAVLWFTVHSLTPQPGLGLASVPALRHLVTLVEVHAPPDSGSFPAVSGAPIPPGPPPSRPRHVVHSLVRMSRFRFSLIAGALVALAACDEAAAPKGTPGDLAVRAYVDRDASGTFTTSDSALAGVEITVATIVTGTAGGLGPTTTASTDASGVATFADLEPGSYRVSLTGGQPAGAVLTTSPTPTVGVSFQGTITGKPEFRFSFYPGVVSGQIFRDDDNSGGYTGGDAVGAGLTVRLRADTGQPGDVLATTTTDNLGQFAFSLVAPGTYWVELENPTTISYGTAGALRRVTVAPQTTIAVPAVFTGSLVVTIAEARAKAAGQAVAVIGNITAAPGSFTSGTNGVNSEIWVQDATGGIAVFSVLTANAAQFPVGQRVQVAGTRGANAGQIQLANPGLSVTALTGSTVMAPRTVTGAQFTARTFDGQLGRITGIVVDSIGTTTSTSFTVFGKAPDGQVVQIRVIGPTTAQANTGLARTNFVTGQRYDVTGLLTAFTSNNVTVAQLKPRSTADVVAAPLATPARVIINEFMANPNTVADAAGEYIELFNSGGTDQNLQGWIISDNFGVDTIDVSLVIPAGGYVVLGVNASRTANGNVPVDFQYVSTIALGNSGDRIQLRDPANVTVDSVAYTSATQAGAGVAWGVIDASADNANASGSNWIAQTTIYNTVGTTTDKGTPRARNDGAVGALIAPSSTAATRVPVGATSNRR
jgi:hypothetical protein